MNLKKLLLGTSLALCSAVVSTASQAGTLEDVKANGVLKCGINTGLAGFASPNAEGKWEGFDIAICRAVAAAVLGDAEKVEYTTTTGQTRFSALASGEIDMLSRNSTWTFGRDNDLKLEFVGVNFYDGQGFMVSKELGVTSADGLDGASVCIQTGTTTELNVAEFFRTKGMAYEAVPVETGAEGRQQYLAGTCDVYTNDVSGLAADRSTFEKPNDHVILPEIISKEPLGPAVRHGDHQWGDIVRWTLNALITAEELGVTADNLQTHVSTPGQRPEVDRLLGTEGDLGSQIGLDKEWAQRVIADGGNYGELFEKFLGTNTKIGLARGVNAQWTNGGLIYSPPFR